LLDLFNDCIAQCNHCTTACLDEKNVQMMVDCIKADIDCAAICALTASLVARDSIHAKHILNECAEACNKCAEQCEKHAEHHKHCKQCAEACRKCAVACAEMI
jgi:hypothetical protein